MIPNLFLQQYFKLAFKHESTSHSFPDTNLISTRQFNRKLINSWEKMIYDHLVLWTQSNRTSNARNLWEFFAEYIRSTSLTWKKRENIFIIGDKNTWCVSLNKAINFVENLFMGNRIVAKRMPALFRLSGALITEICVMSLLTSLCHC